MKKIVLGSLLILAAAGTAFGAGQVIPADGTSIGSQSFKTSNSVSLYVTSMKGNSTDPGGFISISYHASGNRNFGTNSNQPKIFWQDKTTTTATDALTGSMVVTNSTTFVPDIPATWTSL